MKVWFNPSLEVSELPIKRFFRTAISNSLEFDKNGARHPSAWSTSTVSQQRHYSHGHRFPTGLARSAP
ncbi:hypothetical protein PGT21_016872 [Puccinia graminis f. sp. tritici]|uniref:Uncharacterized protein n=1 Tax=Puccinia graminis f. sp. tritici TaxID=56615 RepID=A0A5B0N2Q8_PUCGR|nr:hypothetical protein PGT21_016872 [Puccinia graminis f. sp. tritici]